MPSKHDIQPPSPGDPATSEAKNVKVLRGATKRQRSETGSAQQTSGLAGEQTGLATPEPSPDKKRRLNPEPDAKEKAKTWAQEQEEKEAERERKGIKEAVLQAAKDKVRNEKIAKAMEEKRKQQAEKAALKAAQVKEKTKKKEAQAAEKKEKKAAREKKKRYKEQWATWCAEHNVNGETVDWPEDDEPETISQSDAGKLYSLKPGELACLQYHPRVSPKYGKTTKLFDEEEVRKLAFRKYAMLAGEMAKIDATTLENGRRLWKEECARGPRKTIWSPDGTLEMDLTQGSDESWWRDPRTLRKMGYEGGKLRTTASSSKSKHNTDA